MSRFLWFAVAYAGCIEFTFRSVEVSFFCKIKQVIHTDFIPVNFLTGLEHFFLPIWSRGLRIEYLKVSNNFLHRILIFDAWIYILADRHYGTGSTKISKSKYINFQKNDFKEIYFEIFMKVWSGEEHWIAAEMGLVPSGVEWYGKSGEV